ncbi:MAG: hypothetical protein LCH79_02160 [Proteobacteria bacterium]|jgi:hypothetical protein|nr:hypothetical protein [Pseudomonadota bacterium]
MAAPPRPAVQASLWYLARGRLALAAAIVVVAGGIAYWAHARHAYAQEVQQIAQSRLQRASTELAEAEEARVRLEDNLREFESLSKSGFVGAPDRVALIEALDLASRAVPGANLRWSISPPRLIESVTDLKTGASAAEIQSIPMRLEADSVHEREWLDLLARLSAARMGQLRVQSCEWGASSLPYGPGTVSVMRSLCDVLWIHAQPPVSADKPPGN